MPFLRHHALRKTPEVQKNGGENKKKNLGIPKEKCLKRLRGGENEIPEGNKFADLKPQSVVGNQEVEAIWQDFGVEVLEGENALEVANRSEVEDLFNQYYRIIMGNTMERFLPKCILNDHDGFGRKFWQEAFYAGHDPTILRAAQYLSPRNILEFQGGEVVRSSAYFHAIRSTHFNLCGQLAVIEAMGLSLPQGMRIFYEEVEDLSNEGRYILGNPNLGTYAADLIYFILAIGKRRGENWAVKHQYQVSPVGRLEALEKRVAENELMIALVNIDTHPAVEGSVGASGETAHWVVVQKVFDLAGESFVRIYNPFMNREEIYLWDAFDRGWDKAELNAAPRLIWARKIDP